MRGAPAPKKPKPANTPEEHCAVLGVTIRDLGLEPWDIAKMEVLYKKAASKAHPDSRGGSAEALMTVQRSFEALAALARFQQWGTTNSTYGRTMENVWSNQEKVTWNGRTDAFGSPYKGECTVPKGTL